MLFIRVRKTDFMKLLKTERTQCMAFWTVYIALACGCQYFFGDFPSSFFAFPVNIAVMLLWLAVLWVLFKEKRDSAVSSVLLSFHTTVILLFAFLAACLVQGFSSVKLTGTWWFTAIVFALLSHLFMVIIRGSIRPRPFRARFLLNHAGLFLALAGGLFGSPDTQRWRTIVKLAEPVTEAVDTDGNLIRMPYRLQLTGFCVDSYRDGRPGNYEVTLTADDGTDIVLKVNHPYCLSWKDDLYLAGIKDVTDSGYGPVAGSCIVEIVRQPWKYAQMAGILMLAAGAALLFIQGPAGRPRRRTDDAVQVMKEV